jgi:hypothetical protein
LNSDEPSFFVTQKYIFLSHWTNVIYSKNPAFR